MSEIILSTDRLSVGYEGRTVLRDVNLRLAKGSFTALIGANGSGKSTLLRTLAGGQAPLGGEVLIGSCSVAAMDRRQLASARALVNTARNGGGAMTVEEAVGVSRYVHTGIFGRLSSADREAVDKALEAVGIAHFRGRYLGRLSDGEKQKVMIARALAQATPLVILDEPTAFLDVQARIEVLDLLTDLCRAGKTVLLSTHDIAPTLARADNVVVVADGSAQQVAISDAMAGEVLNKTFPKLKYNAAKLDFE